MHAASAYGTAMLDARHPEPARRDLGRARGWINQAIAISSCCPTPCERAFKLGFDRNGLALIELRQGRLRRRRWRSWSPPSSWPASSGTGTRVHRMVLLANRAQLLAVLGRAKEALEDYGAAIAIDPGLPRLLPGPREPAVPARDGTSEALADYESAHAGRAATARGRLQPGRAADRPG